MPAKKTTSTTKPKLGEVVHPVGGLTYGVRQIRERTAANGGTKKKR